MSNHKCTAKIRKLPFWLGKRWSTIGSQGHFWTTANDSRCRQNGQADPGKEIKCCTTAPRAAIMASKKQPATICDPYAHAKENAAWMKTQFSKVLSYDVLQWHDICRYIVHLCFLRSETFLSKFSILQIANILPCMLSFARLGHASILQLETLRSFLRRLRFALIDVSIERYSQEGCQLH